MIGIDLELISKNKDLSIIVRDLANNIRSGTMLNVGHWLRDLSTFDLQCLSSCIDEAFKIMTTQPVPDRKSWGFATASNIIVLIDLLSVGEGLELPIKGETFSYRAELLTRYLGIELLKRRDLGIKINYEKLSLSEDVDGPDDKETIIQLEEKFAENAKKILQDMGPGKLDLIKDMDPDLLKGPIDHIIRKNPKNSYPTGTPGTFAKQPTDVFKAMGPNRKINIDKINVGKISADGTMEEIPIKDIPPEIKKMIEAKFGKLPDASNEGETDDIEKTVRYKFFKGYENFVDGLEEKLLKIFNFVEGKLSKLKKKVPAENGTK